MRKGFQFETRPLAAFYTVLLAVHVQGSFPLFGHCLVALGNSAMEVPTSGATPPVERRETRFHPQTQQVRGGSILLQSRPWTLSNTAPNLTSPQKLEIGLYPVCGFPGN